MISRTQKGALGDADVVTDFNDCHIVNPAILSEPGVFPNREQPRILHSNTRLNDHAKANLRAE